MRLAIVSCSLNPASRSRILAQAARECLEDSGEVDFLDLRDWDLPFCDGGEAYAHPAAVAVKERLLPADGILLALPVYNYATNAAAKNLVELTGSAVWSGKVAGFLVSAGGGSSYLSVMGLATSLMVDFRTLILPRFVYATGDAFQDGRLVDDAVSERVGRLCREFRDLTAAVGTTLRGEG